MAVVRTRILIADDDLDCRELLTRALRGPGTEIATAADGGELLELAARNAAIDLIITDIQMPWMEGLQALASMRAAGLQAPVLVITGLSRVDLPHVVSRMGHASLLHKPFGVAQLRTAVADLLAGGGHA